jgi:predicted MPP superfamily phosphohydrolase
MYETRHFKVTEYTFWNKKIQNDVKLVFLADLHNNCFGERNEELIDRIRQENPDAILLGGDLIIGKGKRIKTEHAYELLKGIEEIAPVYYTFGNHETRVEEDNRFKEYIQRVQQTKTILLNNQFVFAQAGKTTMSLYGLELSAERYKQKSGTGIVEKDIFKDTKELRILLTHSPEFFKEYEETKPDFILAGHNHGGIVRLPFIRGVIATDKTLFPKYSYGIYQKDKTTMILTGGAGTHTIKFRLFNMSEIVTINIRKG